MELIDKVAMLASAAKYDICAAVSCPSPGGKGMSDLARIPVCHSFTPDGRCVSLLKILQTNACKNNCQYCVNRSSNQIPRLHISPEELACMFMEFYKRNYVEGLFLSSGIQDNSTKSMQDMIKTADILRSKYQYQGYIHLKILPGTDAETIHRAALLSNRLSINIEAPTQKKLRQIAAEKDMIQDVLSPMALIQKEEAAGHLSSGHTTQFVVGASQESDREILHTALWLYQHRKLRRAYFSAFIQTEAPLSRALRLREHRLYQADFLYRMYHFSAEELVYNTEGNFDVTMDPKLSLAIARIHTFPVEINQASYHDLLRVPGIGPTSARRIVKVRKEGRILHASELKNLGIVLRRAKPFITLNGKPQGHLDQVCKRHEQLQFDFTDSLHSSLLASPFLLPDVA